MEGRIDTQTNPKAQYLTSGEGMIVMGVLLSPKVMDCLSQDHNVSKFLKE